jgi:hypothetical protein
MHQDTGWAPDPETQEIFLRYNHTFGKRQNMTSIVEENGKAIGQAIKDVGGAFCGAIVSIAKDLQTLGQDTIKAARPEKKSEEIIMSPPPNHME